MSDWHSHIVDVKSEFLHGEFKDGEVIYMKVPLRFEKFYSDDVVLKLEKCIYGLKQAAMAFWQQLFCWKSLKLEEEESAILLLMTRSEDL
jgi:hypothetical protein